MSRITALIAFGVVLFPATAMGQFYPTIAPPNALYQHPAYRYQFNLGVRVPTVFGGTFVGMTAPATRAPQLFSPNLYSGPTNSYRGSPWLRNSRSGYMSGGISPSSSWSMGEGANQELAQRMAAADKLRQTAGSAQELISGEWAYENRGALGIPATPVGRDQAAALAQALAGADEDAVISGESLNSILTAIRQAQAKGAQGPSAFLPPQVVSSVRFAGSPTAEAANLVGSVSNLPFPDAFDDPKLERIRDQVEDDFANAAEPLIDGKPAPTRAVAKLAYTVKQAEEAAAPVIRDLPFDQAIEARRFLNQLRRTANVMKSPAAAKLVNPQWATQGESVAALVNHMAKNKLQFGPAPERAAHAYLTLHKGLATYLFVLTDAKK